MTTTRSELITAINRVPDYISTSTDPDCQALLKKIMAQIGQLEVIAGIAHRKAQIAAWQANIDEVTEELAAFQRIATGLDGVDPH